METFANKVRGVIESGLSVTSKEKVSDSVMFILDLAQSWEEKNNQIVELENTINALNEGKLEWPQTMVMFASDGDDQDTPYGWMHRAINAEYQFTMLYAELEQKQAVIDELTAKISMPSKDEFFKGVRETAENAKKWLAPDSTDYVVNDDLEQMNILFDQWNDAIRGPKMSDAEGRVIYKYQMPVLEQFEMELPKNARILRMADDDGMFYLWAEVDTNAPTEIRKFRSFKTGAKMPDDVELVYIGFCAVFVQMELGLYIYEEM